MAGTRTSRVLMFFATEKGALLRPTGFGGQAAPLALSIAVRDPILYLILDRTKT